MKKIVLLVGLMGLGLFACKKDKGLETVSDVDGNVYKTVKIGDQVWMAENLKVTKLNDGKTPISFVTEAGTWADPNLTDPMFCYYDNQPENMDKYGLLYNWYAVNTGKLAPAGWHVATDADWQKLQDYLIAHGFNYDGTTVDNKIAKALAASSGWIEDATEGNVGNNQISNNKSGFNGLPGGGRDNDGTYLYISIFDYWWSATAVDAISAKCLFIQANKNSFLSSGFSKKCGVAIRCVKD